MELRFDASQDHQLAAIDATVGALEGQPFVLSRLTIPIGAHFQVVANRLDLDADEILANVRAIQADADLPISDGLESVVAGTETLDGPQTIAFPNFSIEMETGTGKTYVYLRTALEMFTRYGLRKFIIVVPSIAVREGVMKTLAMTKAHLEARYGSYRFNVYDSNSPARLRNFCLSDGLEFMVMTIDSFTSAGNVIRQSKDGQDPPLYQLQAVRPVLILDEPQNLETDIRKAALASLNPLFALRYSATHKNSYTLIHRLTPYDAYRRGLVKRIEVASVVEADNANLPFVRVDEIVAKKKTLSATLAVHKQLANGSVRETAITVRPGDDLAVKTDRADYEGFVIDEINLGAGFVRFENGVEVRRGTAVGTEREAILEAQIRYTVEEHFRKQRRLRDLDLKVLSLFFIDKVDNYAPDNGLLRKMFVKAFDDLKAGYPEWKEKSAHQVQASYFASKTRRGGSVEAVDTTTGKTKEDEAAFNLIMREKEKLLSFEEPVAFIFSHSALREGWDNPNVFQICTLREVGSEAERRQQVGRGVRLPVTQAGERLNDDRANVLTVVASESYERFVAGLQSEIEDAYGKAGTPPPPADKRRQIDLKLRKAHMLKPEFQALWDRIKHRTRYSVTIDTEALVSAVLPDLDAATIRSPRIILTKGEMHVSPTEELFEAIQQSGAKTAIDLAGRYPLPNLVEVMESLMETTSPPMRLSRRTLLDIHRRTTNKQAALSNPHAFAVVAVNIIKEKLADQLVAGIRYEKDGDWYEMSQFADVISSYADRVVSSEASSTGGGTHLYDGVPIDSETVERPFAAMLENRLDVKLYIKLPRWFEVDTPVGKYNPDWAVVMDDPEADGETLYLVRETKGGESLDDLRPAERRKISCGKAHFAGALNVDFDVSRPPFGPSSLP